VVDSRPPAEATVPAVEPVEMVAAKLRRRRDVGVCSISHASKRRCCWSPADSGASQREHGAFGADELGEPRAACAATATRVLRFVQHGNVDTDELRARNALHTRAGLAAGSWLLLGGGERLARSTTARAFR
jgi:hypothetical protein